MSELKLRLGTVERESVAFQSLDPKIQAIINCLSVHPSLFIFHLWIFFLCWLHSQADRLSAYPGKTNPVSSGLYDLLCLKFQLRKEKERERERETGSIIVFKKDESNWSTQWNPWTEHRKRTVSHKEAEKNICPPTACPTTSQPTFFNWHNKLFGGGEGYRKRLTLLNLKMQTHFIERGKTKTRLIEEISLLQCNIRQLCPRKILFPLVSVLTSS